MPIILDSATVVQLLRNLPPVEGILDHDEPPAAEALTTPQLMPFNEHEAGNKTAYNKKMRNNQQEFGVVD